MLKIRFVFVHLEHNFIISSSSSSSSSS